MSLRTVFPEINTQDDDVVFVEHDPTIQRRMVMSEIDERPAYGLSWLAV